MAKWERKCTSTIQVSQQNPHSWALAIILTIFILKNAIFPSSKNWIWLEAERGHFYSKIGLKVTWSDLLICNSEPQLKMPSSDCQNGCLLIPPPPWGGGGWGGGGYVNTDKQLNTRELTRAGRFRYFSIFSLLKKLIFSFFIQLIWLGGGFLNRTGAEIGY